LAVSSYFLISEDKLMFHLSINAYVNDYKVLDIFFKYITYLGDGTLVIITSLICLVFNIRLGIALLSSYIVASSISSVLKHFVFEDMNRPYYIFQWVQPHSLKLVEGVDMYIHNSFPSGHATAAFSFWITLLVFSSSQSVKIACLILAVLAAFSRVYLSEHFLMDITAGALLGSIIAFLTSYLFFVKNDKGLLPQLNRKWF
jgi:membrane-associated phospholipid phosphatase